MTSKQALFAVALVTSLALGATAGCAWLQSQGQGPKAEPAVQEIVKTADKVIDHSLAVLTCASYVQRMAFDSPDVSSAPSQPVAIMPEIL